jgi:hypothetical protein
MSDRFVAYTLKGAAVTVAVLAVFALTTFAVAQNPATPQRAAVATGAQLQIERAPLESPKGMMFLKIERVPVKDAVITDLGKNFSLVTKPSTLRSQQTLAEKSGISRLQVDKQTGHISLQPNWEQVAQAKPQLVNKEKAFQMAEQFLQKNELVVKDVSKMAPQQLVTLSRAELKQGGPASISDVGQTVLYQRTIAEKPVMGPGSVMAVDLGSEGRVVGFQRSWNALSKAGPEPQFKTEQEIYAEVEHQVKSRVPAGIPAKVHKLHLIYYGNDKEWVQPAYFFSIELAAPGVEGKSFMRGVVAAAKNTPEPITMRPAPKELPTASKPPLKSPGKPMPPGDPTVGRYVVRDDSHDWVDDANDFKNGLVDGHSSGFAAITFGDYYWDQPYMWTTSESSYVDRWNITLMEGHGNTWLFTTRSNCCDVVNLNSASQPGYGDRAGSSMRFLVLKGCSIIPGPPDRSNWADPWWRIFKGLRQAVGFRTEMYIDDNISYGFAKNLASNHRVLDSWFAATNSSGSYQWERFWGSWGDEIYGYGTVVMIPGHEGDGIYSTAAAPPATTTGLTIWYQH